MYIARVIFMNEFDRVISELKVGKGVEKKEFILLEDCETGNIKKGYHFFEGRIEALDASILCTLARERQLVKYGLYEDCCIFKKSKSKIVIFEVDIAREKIGDGISFEIGIDVKRKDNLQTVRNDKYQHVTTGDFVDDNKEK